MALSKKTTMGIAAGIVVLGIVAYMFWLRPGVDSVSVIDGGPASEAQATFLTLAEQLGSISFDASILDDARFLSLVDIKTTILPEDAGRTDPFAPLPGISVE